MKEQNIWMSPEELQQMLQGSLQWTDVALRATTSRIGMRKSGEGSTLSKPIRKEKTQLLETKEIKPKGEIKPLEGQPVVWLLGSIGILTLTSWFYFVLFSK
jgi:hypothetical protein